jgi:hypothetical protein
MLSHHSRERFVEQLQKQIGIENQTGKKPDVRVNATVFDIMLNRNLHPKIGFTATMTDGLSKEISELAKKHAPVKRALREIPNNYYKLNEKRKK